jgi:hypothetical protein
MLENTLFRGVLSNTRHLDQVTRNTVTKSKTLPEHISSVYGTRKLDPITLACVCDYGELT